MRISESDVRWLRQRLFALEQGRDDDAARIERYLRVIREVEFQDTVRGECSESFLAYWQVPSSIERMTLLMDYGREPVYRIPAHHRLAPPYPVGCFEVPEVRPAELVRTFRDELSYEPPPGPPASVVPEPAAEKGILARLLGL